MNRLSHVRHTVTAGHPLVAQRKSTRLLIGLPVVRIHPRGRHGKRHGKAMATCHAGVKPGVKRRVNGTLRASRMNPSLICREGFRNPPEVLPTFHLESAWIPHGIPTPIRTNTTGTEHEHTRTEHEQTTNTRQADT